MNPYSLHHLIALVADAARYVPRPQRVMRIKPIYAGRSSGRSDKRAKQAAR